MKILFVDTFPNLRGSQIFVFELSNYLKNQGIENKTVYLYKTIKNQSVLPIKDFDIFLDGSKSGFLERIMTINPFLAWKLKSAILEFKPDLILANGSYTLKYLAGIKKVFKISVPMIARWIDDAPFWNRSILKKSYYKNLILPEFDGAIGVSQASLNSMTWYYGFKKPSKVIHRVFDPLKFSNAPSKLEARNQLGFSPGDEILLFLGNLTPQKRPDRFLDLIGKLTASRPNIKALIVGDGPMRRELEIKNLRKVNSQSSQSQISFWGSHQDVSKFLAASDILILTSDTEGLPGVVLEAAHFRVPTVATEVGGIKECLKDGETGIIVPDRSFDGFIKAINSLLDDPFKREIMGEKARELINEDFQIEKVATEFLEFFNQIIKEYKEKKSTTF